MNLCHRCKERRTQVYQLPELPTCNEAWPIYWCEECIEESDAVKLVHSKPEGKYMVVCESDDGYDVRYLDSVADLENGCEPVQEVG